MRPASNGNAAEFALTLDLASRFAAMTLAHIGRQYPNSPNHILSSQGDLREPRELHPIFYGSFDWHSCVHAWWQLARLRRLTPQLPHAPAIAAHFDSHLTCENVAMEIAYFQRPMAASFGRPYGWAWLLTLAAELKSGQDAESRRWHETLLPLADMIARRFLEFLGNAIYPIRSGVHSNSAFALALAHHYALVRQNPALQSAIEDAARRWYFADAGAQAWEPSLIDFLSPTLIEAECMRRVLPAAEFCDWLNGFLPMLSEGKPAAIFQPVTVTDRGDGHIVHLDGLNLSRAWCWRKIASAMGYDDSRRFRLLSAAQAHLEVSLPHVAGDYVAEHWLATFALLVLSDF